MASTEPPGANPVLTRVWRGDYVESQHRGAWVLVDSEGAVLAGSGAPGTPVFARSSIKSLQALPLLESGAAERAGYRDDELALALASHGGETCHTERVAAVLARRGFRVEDLQCGPQPPMDLRARAELERAGGEPSALHNNCSGKHAGFLCLAAHLGVPLGRYLDPQSAGQEQVRAAVIEMSGCAAGELSTAIDGCSAPTFRLPLARLATALARVANPEGLAPVRRAACERMQRAVAAHPELIAGTRKRLCTQLVKATDGRLFPKVGGEAVYVIGVRGAGRGLAVKVDDGDQRGFQALVLTLLARFGFLTPAESAALASWSDSRLFNWAGREVGRIEVLL